MAFGGVADDLGVGGDDGVEALANVHAQAACATVEGPVVVDVHVGHVDLVHIVDVKVDAALAAVAGLVVGNGDVIDRRAASRADCTAGKSKAIRMPMIAITTSNSISVKARHLRLRTTRLTSGASTSAKARATVRRLQPYTEDITSAARLRLYFSENGGQR